MALYINVLSGNVSASPTQVAVESFEDYGSGPLEIRFIGQNLTVDGDGFIDGGTITSIEVWDAGATPPTKYQTITLTTPIPGSDYGDLAQAAALLGSELGAWNLPDLGNEPNIAASSTEILITFPDLTQLRVTGTNFDTNTFSTGTVTAVEYLDSVGSVLQTLSVGFLPVPLAVAATTLGADIPMEMLLTAGGDTYDAHTDFVSLLGGPGNDTLNANGNQDVVADFELAASGVNANLGTGTATGGDGNDVLNGIQHLDGSFFGDTLTGDGANNNIFGREGNDTITGGAGFDYLAGDDGDDSLLGGDDNDILVGGAGADVLNGNGGTHDAVWYANEDGGNGVLVNLSAGTATDTYGDTDTLLNIEEARGTDMNDVLYGSAFQGVTLHGNGGDDEVWGYYDVGDSLDGGDGTNLLAGLGGSTAIMGGAGTDYILTSYGDNTIDAGGGNDWVYLRYGTNQIDLGDGYNLVLSMDLFETSPGENLADSYDTINGGASDDYIYSGRGEDVLNGNDGNDWLAGGEWSDTMTGGAGNDRFIFGDEAGFDLITDFNPFGEDFLDFTTSTLVTDFNDLTVVQNGADLFVGWNNGASGVTLQNVTLADFTGADVLA